MSLNPGTRLGPYEIVSPIGAGGMGEVYRAKDTKLNRDVGVKVLPPAFASDADRLARFTREAQTLAAINHPNIAAIYAVEGSALVMELVEGEDLSEIIAGQRHYAPAAPASGSLQPGSPGVGPRRAEGSRAPRALNIDDAVAIARQIADALEAAHELGVIHRDLKPANVKVRPDGTVKLLDFGLAKAMGATDGSQSNSANSPTMTTPAMTEAGMIMGTAAYMSPEQARGRVVDRRADIWAFGCVLYEMLTGTPAFKRDTVTDTLSAILRDEPDWTPVPNLPPHVNQLLRRCLEKDAKLRLRDIGEARILLSDSASAAMRPVPSSPTAAIPSVVPTRTSFASMAAAGVVMAAIAGGSTWYATRTGPEPVSFAPAVVKITTDAGFTVEPTVAPNGSLIAYASDRGGEGLDIWVQPLPSGEPVQITHNPADDREPDFSPDGSRIVFRSDRNGGGIYEVPALGGAERLIAAKGRAPKFSPDGKWISYSVGGRAVKPTGWITDGRGGTPRQLAASIEFIPSLWCRDGASVIGGGGRTSDSWGDWYAVSVESGAVTQLGVAAALKSSGLSPSGPAAWLGDSILFTVDGATGTSLWAVPMDGCRGAAGPPHRITMGTGQDLSPAVVTAADGVRLFYANVDRRTNIYRLPLPASADAPVVMPLTEDATFNSWPSVSTDGRALAFVGARVGTTHLIVRDLAAKTSNDVAVSADTEMSISPDGKSIATPVKNGINILPVAGGDARSVSVAGGISFLWDWPRPSLITGSAPKDDRRIAIAVNVETGRSMTILDSPTSKFLGQARLSPDGKWMSMMDWSSADRGRVIIVPFDGVTTATTSQIIPITDGQTVVEENAWSPDGNTIYVVSEADGYRCLWFRHLDPLTRQPIGPLTAVAHFHRARQQIVSTADNPQRLDMSPTGLVFAMAERHGNIWMATVKK